MESQEIQIARKDGETWQLNAVWYPGLDLEHEEDNNENPGEIQVKPRVQSLALYQDFLG
jgi:hypothetical protein